MLGSEDPCDGLAFVGVCAEEVAAAATAVDEEDTEEEEGVEVEEEEGENFKGRMRATKGLQRASTCTTADTKHVFPRLARPRGQGYGVGGGGGSG